MTLVGFKTILHKKCRSGKNSEGPVENSWVLDLCPAKRKQISKSVKLQYFCQYGNPPPKKKQQPKNKVKHIYFRHYRIRIDHKV